MNEPRKVYGPQNTAWCPGCGNFSIAGAVDAALHGLGIEPHKALVVGGIGQAAKTPQYIDANAICALHGRALPTATGAKIANGELTVVVHSGDGDGYAEGGNHFLHAIRRNIDLTLVLHNNQVYGLTRGQASPTSDHGFITGAQPRGVRSEPLNGPALAITLGCGFVARSFSGMPEHLQSMLEQAIRHPGFSFVEVMQPCVSFNKVNTFAWYKARVQEVGDDPSYKPADRIASLAKVLEPGESIPIGVLYHNDRAAPFHEQVPLLHSGPLVKQTTDRRALMSELFAELV